jgi:general secretion pathway protein M
MSLAERIERLEERERRLLTLLAVVVFVVLVLLFPLGVTALLHTSRGDNETIREAIAQISASREVIERGRTVRQFLEDRYSRPAPPLASFLAGLASEVGVEIPESQDRAPVPHGKRYEEKSSKITLRRVGMLKVVRFLEKIEQSGHPVSISQLTIRKRSIEPDSFDVDLVVSAFERKIEKAPPPKPETPAKEGAEE